MLGMDGDNEYGDAEIVALSLEDTAHFGVLVNRYEAKFDRYITRLGVRDPDERLDVLQDIFLKIYKNLHGYDNSYAFSSWAYRIAHNEAISWYRKRNVRPEGHLVNESEEVLLWQSSSETSGEQLFDESVNASVLRQSLESLDEKYRSVIILHYFEYKSYEEISDILKIPIGSVGTLIHRSKKKLQKTINPEHVRV